MTLPKVDLSWMRPSDKVPSPARGGRKVGTSTPTISTATSRPSRYDDLYSSPRYPSPTAVGIRRHTKPHTSYKSRVNCHTRTAPAEEPGPPEAKILYVVHSSAHPGLMHQLTSLPADSVMGATGSGKSTVCYTLRALLRTYQMSPRLAQFINLVAGSNLDVGRGLKSCTNTVQVAEAFRLDGRPIVLIDTPGFNDTTKSDTEILRTIVAFLGAS